VQCSDENTKRSRVAEAPKEGSCNIELKKPAHLPSKNPTHTDDAQDVEHS